VARLRSGRNGRPMLLLIGGAIAFVSGALIVIASLAPMSAHGPNTSTLAAQPAPVAAPAGGSTGSGTAPTASGSDSNLASLDRPVNGVAFEMSVPAIGYSATVREGVDLATLEYGPGHYPTTVWPGQPGIVGVAAHNVYWLRFTELKSGVKVDIRTRRGVFVYRITGSEVTDPSDRTILVPTQDHRLVLTTCFPLWAGAFARQRLIYFATEMGPGGRPA
jgi:sortase A